MFHWHVHQLRKKKKHSNRVFFVVSVSHSLNENTSPYKLLYFSLIKPLITLINLLKYDDWRHLNRDRVVYVNSWNDERSRSFERRMMTMREGFALTVARRVILHIYFCMFSAHTLCEMSNVQRVRAARR